MGACATGETAATAAAATVTFQALTFAAALCALVIPVKVVDKAVDCNGTAVAHFSQLLRLALAAAGYFQL